MTDSELLADLESGRIPVGYLYRHNTDSMSSYCKAGDWEWYDLDSRSWNRGPTLRECCQKLREGK